ncbi:MAG: hypothetical protein ACI87W_000063 [Halieaceae bacterium]|jgi:hypothetical protein
MVQRTTVVQLLAVQNPADRILKQVFRSKGLKKRSFLRLAQGLL